MSAEHIIKIDIPMPIVTDRLILRNVRPGDAPALHAAKMETFDQLRLWMPWAKEIGSIEETGRHLSEACKKFEQREDLMMAGFLKREDGGEGALAVCTGLHRMDWNLRIFEIGYWVPKSQQRKGVASESTNALIRYAFNALAARKIKICHAEGNDASRGVIERLGFEKEGIFKGEAHLPAGTVTDHHWYARFNDKGLPPLNLCWG